MIEIVELLPATTGSAINMRISTDNGSTWRSTSGDYAWVNLITSSTASSIQQNIATATSITWAFNQNSGTYGFCATIKAFNPGGSTLRKVFMGTSFLFTSASILQVGNNYGAVTATTAITSFQFLASSGNLASGSIRIYGIAKS
jgi:hypothetical protein